MESKYVKWAKRAISIALECVEGCPEEFKVVAFEIVLKDLVNRLVPLKEEG